MKHYARDAGHKNSDDKFARILARKNHIKICPYCGKTVNTEFTKGSQYCSDEHARLHTEQIIEQQKKVKEIICPCIKAEKPLCHPECWHFGGTQKCKACDNTGIYKKSKIKK